MNLFRNLIVGLACLVAWIRADAALLELKPGDHIAIVGHALPDRMQHHGGLETLIHARFPQHQLVIRNLAAAGDEVATWHRSENFGSRDEWLTKTRADVIFAFYGFNESFAGAAGLDKFKQHLDKFLKHTKAANYSGKGSPRLVLFSPIANEKLADPNQPDPAANNANLQKYTAAMAEVAQANAVPFVDLFSLSQRLYAQAAAKKQSLTFNTFLLTEAGDQALAPEIFQALFNEKAPAGDHARLRAAVLDKNAEWHARYRTVDGYNVYGGRSRLSFPKAGPGSEKISNYDVMQEEMSQRDVKTANRDQRVWAVAQGGDLKVVDTNLPPVRTLESNKPDVVPFLSGTAAIEKMTVAKGCKVNLFASEEMFPELASPVQMAFDPQGRLWVAVWPSYPGRTPTDTVGDKLLVFEDTNNDGQADKVTTFLDDLNCPTGFQFYKDGVLVMQAPDLWFVRDTNGDGKADWKERVLMGMDSADTHHTANSMVLDPGGATYLSDGVFHRSQVETATGPVRNEDGCIYRYEPLTGKFERYAPYAFANPHGRVFDRWGTDIITDATGNRSYFGPAISGYLDYPAKHEQIKEIWDRPARPSPGTGMLSSRHFPEEFQGNFLNCNVLGFQGIYRVKLSPDGAGLKGDKLEDLVQSTDPNFRPVAAGVAPDGSLYFLDWAKPLIGHMQHHLRDPNRDKTHGRIYRITYEGRPLLKPAVIAGQPIPTLLDLLKTPEDDVRTRVKIELGKHDSAQVIAAVKKWTASLDAKDKDYEHHLTEALWVHQWHNVVNEELLRRMLRSPDYRARAAATRVLCYWRDRVNDPLGLLEIQARDDSPRVRLEAVRACSFFKSARAAEIVLTVLDKESDPEEPDYYLQYCLNESMRALEKYLVNQFAATAEADGVPQKTLSLPKSPQAAAYVLGRLSDQELIAAPRGEFVFTALVQRPGLDRKYRFEALEGLARLRNTDVLTELLATLEELDRKRGRTWEPVLRDLSPILLQTQPATLAAKRPALVKLATGANRPLTRQMAYAAIINADAGVTRVWAETAADARRFADLLLAIPLVRDANLRANLYSKVAPLLDQRGAPFVRRAAITAIASLPGHEAESFNLLAALVKSGTERATAIASLQRIPRSAWPVEAAAPLLESLLTYLQGVPADERTEADASNAFQFASDLAALLPSERAAAFGKRLRALGVSVFVLRAIPEQMLYDKTLIVVEAGKPVEIVLINDDTMPHNLVITAPGALEEIGNAAEKMPLAPDAQGRVYVPDSPKVLHATRMVESGRQVKLSFTAPTTPGDYPYVCTYPGHWRRMTGTLAVVPDVEAYLASHAAAQQPKTTEWKTDDLGPALAKLQIGRNLARGHDLFTKLACASCHKFGREGVDFGPELTTVFAQYQNDPKEVLRHIIEPSLVISNRYRSFQFELKNGDEISGLIIKDEADSLTVQAGASASLIQTFKKSDVQFQQPLNSSVMPPGLLNQLSADEILDLLAFLKSGGQVPAHEHKH